MRLPCGGCLGCRKAQARSWALRCHLETQQHTRAAFTTLTYDDQHLPVTLSKRHLQLYIKRVRKALGSKRPLRFFACGEYGERTHRPHYHAILYGADERDSDLLDNAWGAGHTKTVRVTPAAIAYVAGYTAKKIGFKEEAGQERIDYETGELYHWQPPFLQMSRRPGIGGHARCHANSWRSFAIYNGTPQPVPRFLHEAWKATASLEDLELLAQEKAALPRKDLSPARLEAAEQIAVARQIVSAARRTL